MILPKYDKTYPVIIHFLPGVITNGDSKNSNNLGLSSLSMLMYTSLFVLYSGLSCCCIGINVLVVLVTLAVLVIFCARSKVRFPTKVLKTGLSFASCSDNNLL